MKLTKSKKDRELERILDSKLTEMLETAENQKDFEEIMDIIERKANLCKSKIDPNTVAIIAGNLAGIMLILNFEKLNVVTSKALSFVLKGRV